jgi:hypothetical protein
VSAELAARRTAAAAVAADFHTTMVAWLGGGERPDYAAWAQRLEQHLRYVLDALDVQDRAQPASPLAVDLDEEVTEERAAEIRAALDAAVKPQPAPELAEVRRVLEAFDWETGDRQYALEQIDGIVNGDPK